MLVVTDCDCWCWLSVVVLVMIVVVVLVMVVVVVVDRARAQNPRTVRDQNAEWSGLRFDRHQLDLAKCASVSCLLTGVGVLSPPSVP